MKRQSHRTIATPLLRAASLPVVIFLAVQLIPRAVGQRHINRKSSIPTGVCPTPWQVVANMPLDLFGTAGASDGAFSYHFGGFSFSTGKTLDVVNRYDPVGNSWAAMASMPQAAFMASAVYYPPTNKIYVFGGEDADTGVNYDITRIYDISSNTWTTGANMPDVRSFMASGYNGTNGRIYLVSGYNTGLVDSAQPNTWEYDPVADAFTERAPFPHPAGGFASGVINGHLYVAGGRDASNTVIDLVWDYNIANDTWTARSSMPSVTNVPGNAVALGRLWVFGGGNPFSVHKSSSMTAVFDQRRVKLKSEVPTTTNIGVVYNPETDIWSSSPSMNVSRSFTSGTAIGTKLVAAGGFDGTSSVSITETLDACLPTTCGFQVLIIYADSGGQPSLLQSQILAEPGVASADFFQATNRTPTLAQLQLYDIVVPFSNNPFADPDTLGNNLADYVDGGGIVVQLGFSHDGPSEPNGINGRWVSGSYNPYSYSTNFVFNTPFTLGTFNAEHPLMAGVSELNSDFQNIVTPAPGATEVAAASNDNSLVAYRQVGSSTTVGITAFLGVVANQSGHWGRVIVNAGNWLGNNGCGPTPTPTSTATPAVTPRPRPTPRSRPTPPPRPTPPE
jgi:hypothetical protein